MIESKYTQDVAPNGGVNRHSEEDRRSGPTIGEGIGRKVLRWGQGRRTDGWNDTRSRKRIPEN